MTKQIHLRLVPSCPAEGGGLTGSAEALRIAETVLLLEPRRSLVHCPQQTTGFETAHTVPVSGKTQHTRPGAPQSDTTLKTYISRLVKFGPAGINRTAN